MLKSIALVTGIWRATLSLPDADLPFNFKVNNNSKGYTIEIINADEKILVDEISFKEDSVFIKLPVFDSEIRAKVSDNQMTGNWINYSRKTNQSISFNAKANASERFIADKKNSHIKLNNRYEVWFSPHTKDSSFAIALFNQTGEKVHGTFLTTTGDYRYLEGLVNGDSLFMSCFDGAHAYLFKAKVDRQKIGGMYYSGNHWKEEWTATKNDTIELPDGETITKLKAGQNTVSFNFKNLDGSDFLFPNDEYQGKVTVLQIMGSWCPNCMDETAFLSPFYDRYKSKGFEVIGLSFEKTDDFAKAVSLINRTKNKHAVKYRLLAAGNRDLASQNMSMLEKINGYPTTIFIDKKGIVRKIHTGFTGPATGKYYEKFKDDFTAFIEKLLAE